MDDSSDRPAETHTPPTPLEVMRAVFLSMDFQFEEEEETLTLRLALENLDVVVTCWGSPGDVATILVRLPIRATEEFRAKTGEFLHRLNFDSKRKFWEFDYNDGEIRLAAYADTTAAPLCEAHFRGLLHCMLRTVDVVFPYLTSVLSGRMLPDFAADQADAALRSLWGGEGEEPDDPPVDDNN